MRELEINPLKFSDFSNDWDFKAKIVISKLIKSCDTMTGANTHGVVAHNMS